MHFSPPVFSATHSAGKDMLPRLTYNTDDRKPQSTTEMSVSIVSGKIQGVQQCSRSQETKEVQSSTTFSLAVLSKLFTSTGPQFLHGGGGGGSNNTSPAWFQAYRKEQRPTNASSTTKNQDKYKELLLFQ